MHRVIVRVWLPDRPGALGQVASRVGAVRGDVVGVEILERGAGRAIDELVVELDSDQHVSLLVDEIHHVDGVSVEHVRAVGERAEPGLAALSLCARVSEARPSDRLQCLLDGLLVTNETEWAAAVRNGGVIARAGAPPSDEWLLAYVEGSAHLTEQEHADGGDVLLARMIRTSITIAAGRSERPVHHNERVRLALLVRVADALVDGGG